MVVVLLLLLLLVVVVMVVMVVAAAAVIGLMRSVLVYHHGHQCWKCSFVFLYSLLLNIIATLVPFLG